MILVICGVTHHRLLEGDLIEWHSDNYELANKMGIYNSVKLNKFPDADAYLNRMPFTILRLPLVTEADCLVIRDDGHIFQNELGSFFQIRKFMIDASTLEQRADGELYPVDDTSPTRQHWSEVIPGRIRRDTHRAYREIIRSDITINDIRIDRPLTAEQTAQIWIP